MLATTAARLARPTIALLLLALAPPAGAAHHRKRHHHRHISVRMAAVRTTVTSGPAASTSSGSATFTFRATRRGARFVCRLDMGSWAGCRSPRTYTGLAAGDHTFEVRAISTASAVWRWHVVAATAVPLPSDPPVTPAPTGDPVPAAPAVPAAPTVPAVTAPVGTKSTWRPVGSPILSDAEAAAHVRRSAWEPRPGNATPNHTVPTQEQRDYFNAQSQNYQTRGLFTGDFTGTTDEIIQWVSWKWGLDEDVVRAVAAVESWWNQNAFGFAYQGGGLMSPTWSQNPGINPIGMTSTAANLELFAGYMREYYDDYQGKANWLNNVDHGQPYQPGDMWGSIGAWYAGRWHTAAAEAYITKVKDYLARRVWEQPGF